MATSKPQQMDAPRAPFAVQRPPRGATHEARPDPASEREAARVRLTGRGAILLICAVSLVFALIGHLGGSPLVGGVAFTAACVGSALFVRPSDLLSLTVSPPLAFFAAALMAEMVLTLGDSGFSRGVTIGLATRLADVAPSLFLGTALVLVIAVFRGLPGNIRQLSDELNGRRPRTPPADGTSRDS